jgi:hypothetical protein
MIARRSIPLVLVWVCALVGALLVCSAPALAQRKHGFGLAFGEKGSGPGQLSQPGQVAVDETTGDVYVLDRGNQRIETFNSAGAYVGQFNGGETPAGSFAFRTEGSARRTSQPKSSPDGAIAVDNTANPLDPSKGDVYVADVGHDVVDKFTAGGSYIGRITGTSPSSPFLTEDVGGGLVVDPNGDLWVEDNANGPDVDKFNDAAPINEYVSSVAVQTPGKAGSASRGGLGLIGVALDSEGDLYTGIKPSLLGLEPTFPDEFSASTGLPMVNGLDEEETTGLAVDGSSNDVYVDHETSVAVYGPSHHPIEGFGSGQLTSSEGIAVSATSGTVYASDALTGTVMAFPAFVVPDVSTGEASGLGETSVTVNGVVNPDGVPVTACVFEYGTSEAYGQSAPCSSSPSGSAPVAVSAQLSGLSPLTRYHFRLSVTNANGSNQGLDRIFVTPQPVALAEEAVSDVSASSALFSVQVDPGGADTTYRFEYGTSEAYGASVPVPAGDAGSETSAVAVSVRVEGLLPETVYHARVVASNVLGTVYGPDEVFITQSGGGAFHLPDGREWELVSPPNKGGAVIFAAGGAQAHEKANLVEASRDGSAISYAANAPAGGGVQGNSDPFTLTQVLSRRDPGGWSSEDVTPPHAGASEGQALYAFFSPELTKAVLEPEGINPLLSPEATETTPYLRDDGTGAYTPLVGPSDVPAGTRFAPQSQKAPLVVGATPDLSHLLIKSKSALTSDAVESAQEDGNLYEWSAGRLQLVNQELPGSSEIQALGGEGYDDVRNVISSDGSRVFFGHDGELYMRDTVAGRTVRVDATAPGMAPSPVALARFQIASADGSTVFFLDEQPLTRDSKLKPVQFGESSDRSDLYVYEAATGLLTDLSVDPNASEAAEVQNAVVGASEDGSVVYFVARGRLAEGAQAGGYNLYVESRSGGSWSAPRLVAVLSREDAPDWAESLQGGFQEMFRMSSRVSASGRYLVFMSDRSLMGYDNRDALSGAADEEVFVYDDATSALRCLSCNPTGARPNGLLDEGEQLVDLQAVWEGRWLAGSVPGWTQPVSSIDYNAYYQSRVLFDDGRVFFDSPDALVPQATNGKEDVYEYEPLGVGGCARAGGCVSLISAGTSADESVFLDASESGDDVFFLSTARLVPADVDSAYDVYDAHACSTGSPCVVAPVVPPPCTSGDACKAPPSPQPAIFGAPASATFSGAGNVAGSAVASGPVPKSGAKKRRPARHRRPKRKRSRGAPRGRVRRGRGLSAGTGR